MSSVELFSRQLSADWPSRVCLPYDVDLLQLARWLTVANKFLTPPQFDIVIGDRSYSYSGLDPIELFNEIQRNCVNYSLSCSYVVCKHPKSMMFFDIHDRFIFFAADLNVLRELYPFSTEIMRENFSLLQEEDDDVRLAEVFQAVHSVTGGLGEV